MTAAIAWKPHYSVGNASLDAQHRQILALVNEIYAAREKDDNAAAVESLLKRLLQYAQSHFGYEERLMAECGYPGLAEQKASHDKMRRRTAGLLEHAGLVMPEDLLHFLKDWWINHIQGEDKLYAPYLSVHARA